MCLSRQITEDKKLQNKKKRKKGERDMSDVPGAPPSHLGLHSHPAAFSSYSQTSDHCQVCAIFNINRSTGVESLPENLGVRIKQCDGGRRGKHGWWGAGGQGAIFPLLDCSL